MVYLYPDEREETESTTLVEFPAYGGQLDEVRRALDTHGFDPGSLLLAGIAINAWTHAVMATGSDRKGGLGGLLFRGW